MARPLLGVAEPLLCGVDAPLDRLLVGWGSRDGVPLAEREYPLEVVVPLVGTVLSFDWLVLYVTVVVVRPPALVVSVSIVVKTSAVSLSSEMSLPMLCALLLVLLLGRLLAWLLAAKHRNKCHKIGHYINC